MYTAAPTALRWLSRLVVGGVCLAAAVSAASCSDKEAAATAQAEPTASVSFQATIRPILEQRCAQCHADGAAAPMVLGWDPKEWEKGPPAWAELAVTAVSSGRMPPWMPSDQGGCLPLAGDRRLTASERAAFGQWQAGGFAKGNEADYIPGEGAAAIVGEPDLTLKPAEAYAPDRTRPDDYRCFILPQEFAEDTFVVSTTVLPEHRTMAHHALLFQIPPEQVKNIEALDDEEAGPGYTCFGGPGGSVQKTMGAWVPGTVPTRTPEGAAIVVTRGSRLVLQMHYNTLSLPAGPAPADRSTVGLWTMPRPQVPTQRVESLPFAHLGITIAAGEKNSVQERTFTVPADGTIVAVAPHMHKLGTRISMSLERDGKSQCLVDIPEWDFNWQQQYNLGTAVQVKRGERLKMRCEYDNTKQNQAVVNGVRLEPRDVAWGEGTLDEMCLTYVSLMRPYEEPPVTCGDFNSCQASCAQGDGGCFFACATESGGQCGACLVPSLSGCAVSAGCAETGIGLRTCLEACDDPIPCLQGGCKTAFDGFYACMEPYLEAGKCNERLALCGVSY